MSHCTKKKLQKLNPSGNFSQFDPQKFVPANLKRWPIHKIKAHKNFMLHGIRWFFFHPFNWNVIWFPFNVSTLSTFSFLCKAVSLLVHFLPSYISFFFSGKGKETWTSETTSTPVILWNKMSQDEENQKQKVCFQVNFQVCVGSYRTCVST